MKDVIVGINGSLVAIDPSTGKTRWKVVLSSAGLVSFAFVADLVIASSTDNSLVAVDRNTGTERFRVRTSEHGKATLLVAGEQLFVAKAGVLECFGLDGTRRWKEGFPGMGNFSVSLGCGDQVVQADERD
jgi:outer membrane protein assembly factor BamB